MSPKYLLSILTAVLLAGSAQAQYTDNNQTNTISGVSSNWADAYFVGDTFAYDALLIQNGGVLSITLGYIGFQGGADFNTVLVTGSGSVWSNASDLYVGFSGAENSLTVTNGATVYNGHGYIGYEFNADLNTVLVTGSGSVWSNASDLSVGYLGDLNSLTVSNGGIVYNGYGYIGNQDDDNAVLVTGTGSIWRNASDLSVGYYGAENSLTIAGSGTVYNATGYIGNQAGAYRNAVLVTGSGSVWSNAVHLYVGNFGAENLLTITNGGAVVCANGSGFIGHESGANNNTVLVTGSGSLWQISATLYVGAPGSGNSLTIADGGVVYSFSAGEIGVFGGGNNSVLVTGFGSLWETYQVNLGIGGSGNSLTISNGGVVDSANGTIGVFGTGSNNAVTVTGTGSVWNVSGVLVGDGSSGNQLVVGTGGTVFADNAVIGLDDSSDFASNNVLQVNGGSLFVSNFFGNGQLSVGQSTGPASLILNGGTVTVNQLLLTNGVNSVFTFNAGALDSGGTLVAAPQTFTVGDGADAAVFHLSGGIHSFGNQLEITSNAMLTGCGTINGNVLIDAGGAALANCGGTLTFAGSVTNNGSIVATNGTIINFYGPVINNGQIGPTNSIHYYFVPSTAATNSWINPTSDKWEAGLDWSAGPPSIIQPALYITNASSKTVTMDVNTAIAYTHTLTVSNLTVSGPSGSTNTLLLNGMAGSSPLQIVSNLNVNAGGIVSVVNSALEVDGSGAPPGSGLFVGVTSAGEQLSINGGQVGDDSAYLGYNSSSSNNTVLVTGSGSVWSNASYLYVGYLGPANHLTIANGGILEDASGAVGGSSITSSNTVLVSGNGSVWSNSSFLSVGNGGSGNSLTIANGGRVYNGNLGIIGSDSGASNNTVLVNGSGSVWTSGNQLMLGNSNSGNQIVVTNSGEVDATAMFVGLLGQGTLTLNGGTISLSDFLSVGRYAGSTGAVWITAGTIACTNNDTRVGRDGVGQMTVSNGTVSLNALFVGYSAGALGTFTMAGGQVSVIPSNIVVGYFAGATGVVAVAGGNLALSGNGNLIVGQAGMGAYLQSGGTVVVNQLVLTNGANSVFTFNAGQLTSSGTSVTNSQLFVVGDGTDAATFQLNGGVHSFADNLEISSNAVLTGCGTINGNVTIDPGGTVLANCGGTLTFTGIVTNNGTIQAVNGTALQADGPVVNNGVINAINGTTEFLGGLVNNGVVLTETDVQISSIARSGNNITVQIPSVTDAMYQLQVTPSLKPANWTNLNASQSGTGGVLSFTDTGGATNHPGRFYRIDITLP